MKALTNITVMKEVMTRGEYAMNMWGRRDESEECLEKEKEED